MIPTTLTYLASAAAEAESGNVFDALGIKLDILIVQIVAFLLLVWLLGKFVYPKLMQVVDARQEAIEDSMKAAAEAEKKAENAEKDIAKLLKTAKTEAAQIITTAKDEATALSEKADVKAKARADKIVTDAHEQLDKDVLKARKSLESDTLALVKQATSIVTAGVADDKLDTALLKKALEEAKA